MSNPFNNFLNFHPPTAYPNVHVVTNILGTDANGSLFSSHWVLPQVNEVDPAITDSNLPSFRQKVIGYWEIGWFGTMYALMYALK